MTRPSITADGGGGLGLPPLFTIRGFEGSTADYIEELYREYRCVVGEDGVRLWGKKILAPGRQGADGRDKRFWHLITDVGRDCAPRRSLSLERCATLPRVLWTLSHFAAGDAPCFSWREGKCDLCLITTDLRLHLVLRERRDAFVLTTAYPIDNADRAARLMDRAARFWLSGRSVRTHRKTPRRLLCAAAELS
jgi:hypothetical protein